MKKIYILWLRQLKRYLRSRSRIVGSLAQPLLFLVALGYGLGPVFQQAGQGNYINFLAPGIIGMSIIFTAIFSGIEIIWDRQFGFLKEVMVAPVSRLNIMIGRTLGGATVATLQGAIVLLISLLFGFRPINLSGMILVIPVMFLVAVLFTSIGTIIASLFRRYARLSTHHEFFGDAVIFSLGRFVSSARVAFSLTYYCFTRPALLWH